MVIVKISSLLLSFLIASSVALPWHDEKHTFDSRQQVSQAATRRGPTIQSLPVTNNGGEYQCETLAPQLFAGNRQAAVPVHVCQDDSTPPRVCYMSKFLKCCGVDHDSAITLPGDEVVTVGNQNVAVKFYRAGSLNYPVPSACLFFPRHVDISACPDPTNFFFFLYCDRATRVCRRNSEPDSCTVNGCRCKPGYLPPTCCNCDYSTHFKAANGSCLRLCDGRCTDITSRNGCPSCQPGYKPPSCCEVIHYVKGESFSFEGTQIAGNSNSVACRSDQIVKEGKCVCPPGRQEFYGNCY